MSDTKFGTATFEEVVYNLQSQPELTGRQLDSRFTNYNEATEGENYDVEFSAQAMDTEGNEVTIYWMFEFEKLNEPELDSLNWDNVDRVVKL